jgi:hypothetical protein
MARRVPAIVILFMLAVQSAGAQTTPISIILESTGEDRVGKDLVYAVREEIRKSAGYKLVDSSADAALMIMLVSLDVEDQESQKGVRTAAAIVVTGAPATANRYLDSYVVVVGRDRTATIARSILASIDGTLARLRKQYSSPGD